MANMDSLTMIDMFLSNVKPYQPTVGDLSCEKTSPDMDMFLDDPTLSNTLDFYTCSDSVPMGPSSPPDGVVPSSESDDDVDIENPSNDVIARVLAKRPSDCTARERIVRKRAMNRKAATVSRKRRRVNQAKMKDDVESYAHKAAVLETELAKARAQNEKMAHELEVLRRVVNHSPALIDVFQRLGLDLTLTPTVAAREDDSGSSFDDDTSDAPPAKRQRVD